jgi:hypothetical protein
MLLSTLGMRVRGRFRLDKSSAIVGIALGF